MKSKIIAGSGFTCRKIQCFCGTVANQETVYEQEVHRVVLSAGSRMSMAYHNQNLYEPQKRGNEERGLPSLEKAQGLGPCSVEIRGFKSLPPHFLRILFRIQGQISLFFQWSKTRAIQFFPPRLFSQHSCVFTKHDWISILISSVFPSNMLSTPFLIIVIRI